MEEEKKNIISEYMREIAKIGHLKKPRSRDWYSKIGKAGGKAGKGVKKPRNR